MSLGQLSRANLAYERAIAYARRFGIDEDTNEPYYFIDLILVDPGRCRKENFCISGIDDLSPNPPRPNLETGDEEYTFSKHKGGSIKFVENPNDPGLWTFPMWDTDFNREVLASHYDLGHWRIADEELDAIISKRAAEMRAEVVEKTQLEKEIEELNTEYKSAEKKDQQKIMDKISRLINENANEVLKTKGRVKTDPIMRKRSRIRIPMPKKPEPIKAEIPEGEEKPKKVDKTPEVKGEESESTELVEVKHE